MWSLLALIISVPIMASCAIAFGSNSRAEVSAPVDTKREVVKDTATIEDVLVQKEKVK